MNHEPSVANLGAIENPQERGSLSLHAGDVSSRYSDLLPPREILELIGLCNADGFIGRRAAKKLDEVLGFAEQILKVVETDFISGNDERPRPIRFLECSCGKSYLSFILSHLLKEQCNRDAFFFGTDTNNAVIQKCEEIKASLGCDNMEFFCGRTLHAAPRTPVDIAIALHACDTATDEAIAKGIKLSAKYVIVVPCCQNQIRGQIRSGHPLVNLTEFGPLKYKFADLLTEALRSLFLRGAGYSVKLMEVVPPTVTPKNIMILARKTKRKPKRGMEDYLRLRDMFNVHPRIEDFLPELVKSKT